MTNKYYLNTDSKNLLGEEWRPVPGYEGIYEVSNLGRVRSLTRKSWNGINEFMLKGKIKSQTMKPNGYLFVRLSNSGKAKNYYVHRLVGISFIPNPKRLQTINHKNEFEKWNNTVSNLEWMSLEDNERYGTHLKRTREHTDEKAKALTQKLATAAVKRPVCAFFEDGTRKFFSSQSEASSKLSVSNCGISNCCRGKLKKTGGIHFEYAY